MVTAIITSIFDARKIANLYLPLRNQTQPPRELGVWLEFKLELELMFRPKFEPELKLELWLASVSKNPNLPIPPGTALGPFIGLSIALSGSSKSAQTVDAHPLEDVL